MKLILRGHHLLCLKGFQGYGYDESFVENMSRINRLRKLQETTIALTDESDDICRACPNLENDLCQNEKQNERIMAMDDEVLSKLDPKKEYSAPDLFEKIDEIFNSKESLSEICSNCMWHEECLFYRNI